MTDKKWQDRTPPSKPKTIADLMAEAGMAHYLEYDSNNERFKLAAQSLLDAVKENSLGSRAVNDAKHAMKLAMADLVTNSEGVVKPYTADGNQFINQAETALGKWLARIQIDADCFEQVASDHVNALKAVPPRSRG